MLNLDTLLMRLNSDLQRPFRQDLSTENLNLHSELNVKLRDRLTAFKAKQDPILANRTLSDEGKAAAIAKLATGAVGDFTFLEVVSSREQATVARLRTTMYTVPMPTTMTADDAREIRQEYAGLSQQERDMTFLRTCELSTVADPDDPESQGRHTEELHSLLGKRGRALVTPDIKTRGLDERARQLFPSTFAELQQAEIMAEQLSGLRDHVALWLNGLGADPQKVHAELGGPEPMLPPMQAELARRQPVAEAQPGVLQP